MGRLDLTLNESGLNRLLARGVPVCNVEQLLHSFRLVVAELMHQGSTVRAGPEHQDDVSVTDLGELMGFLGETPDVPKGCLTVRMCPKSC
jgi:hypothetical protein